MPAARGRFKHAWEQGQLARWVKVLTAPLFFVAGGVLQWSLDGGLKQLDARWIVVGVLAFAITAAALVLVSMFGSQELTARHQRDATDSALREITSHAKRLEVISELVPEGSAGETYTATTNLIRRATDSLVFVDIWVPPDASKPYQEPGSKTQQARDDYYSAIVKWLENRLAINKGGVCYRRIIQLDPEASVTTLASDPTTRQHVAECVRLRGQGGEGAARIERADKRFWSNVAIIDSTYVVHTILVVKDGRPSRHAAMIYEDSHQKIVPRYQELIERLEARPLEDLDSLLVGGADRA